LHQYSDRHTWWAGSFCIDNIVDAADGTVDNTSLLPAIPGANDRGAFGEPKAWLKFRAQFVASDAVFGAGASTDCIDTNERYVFRGGVMLQKAMIAIIFTIFG
jgi:hypothetical protein